jgi:hypothetical protein
MATKVFISYRRDDSAGSAGRVHDRLERDLGRDLLFMDVDAIPLGVNFVKILRDEVAKCHVLLAMIGPTWLDARDEHGNRRLDDPNDFLRIESGTALNRNIPVIPILLDGAKIPKAEQLPTDLQELEQRHGLDVRHASFHSDVDKLSRWLKERSGQFGTPPTLPPQSNESWNIAKVAFDEGPEENPITEAETLGREENTRHQDEAGSKRPADQKEHRLEVNEHKQAARLAENQPTAHRGKTGIATFLQSRRTILRPRYKRGEETDDYPISSTTPAGRDRNRLEISLVAIGSLIAIGLFITGAYENCWYAIRISGGMLPNIKYIAAYRTHTAGVKDYALRASK